MHTGERNQKRQSVSVVESLVSEYFTFSRAEKAMQLEKEPLDSSLNPEGQGIVEFGRPDGITVWTRLSSEAETSLKL